MPPRLREPGEFCWINIISPDLDGTRAFFSALLGWRFPEMPGMGYLIEVDGPIGRAASSISGVPATRPGSSRSSA
jgi:predicted enzyme related to lactoylglutathione lyase